MNSFVSNKAKIDDSTYIGPNCIIDDNVEICEGTELISNVHISGNTLIGKDNKFFPFSSIGHIPQDKKYQGEESKLIIGNKNIIREQVTISPGTKDGGMIIYQRKKYSSKVSHDNGIS